VSKFETVAFDIVVNETAAETIFPEYRTIEGKFKIPMRRILKRGGEETENLSYTEVKINQTFANDFFSPPTEEFTPAVPGLQNEPVLEKLSSTVYLVRASAGYNAMFVAFPTYVLVLEAPINDLTSRQVIARIKEAVPDKPIKYLAVTHHHTDHSGGVREYVRLGANIVTTPGNRGFFTRMVSDVFMPSIFERTPIARREFIETFQKKRVFSEGDQTIELYDIGAGPHAEEMTIAYLPKEKIIFQGDLLNLPDDGRLTGANATTKHFADWVEKSKLAIEKIVAVHGPAFTPEQMRQALKSIR
jgi:glyoxylase-like metal-dependent hydrolase (beta-lactamase superfamily II)